MTKKKEIKYEEQGQRLKKIRKALDLSKIIASKECGLSCRSIFNYESGVTQPNLEYLLYLHNRYEVNLNFVFNGEKSMFRLGTKDTPPDFGELQSAVYNLLRLMHGCKYKLYSILAYAVRISKERW